jgi:Icc-related predicted phosphoesterase
MVQGGTAASTMGSEQKPTLLARCRTIAAQRDHLRVLSRGLHTKRARLLASIGVLLATTGCRRPRCSPISELHFERSPPTAYPDRIARPERPLAIVGDTQRTSYQECIIGREVNDRATQRILRSIAAADPGLLIIVGDMIFDGSSALHWEWFDWLMQPVREARIPVLPALGNHDYWGSTPQAMRNAAVRFPRLSSQTRYIDRYGPLGLVWLDSNAEQVGESSWAEQTRWFQRTLAAFDADGEVRGVIVFLHHPPYTNSEVVEGDRKVRGDLVPPFADARKTLAMVSGHAHGYEHFVVTGKHFIVTAGGGGPRGKLHASRPSDPADSFDGVAPRPFNYLLVLGETEGIRIETRGFDGQDERERVLESTTIAFATAASLTPTGKR